MVRIVDLEPRNTYILKNMYIIENHFNNDYPVAIYTGRIQKVKKIELLIKSMSLLQQKKGFNCSIHSLIDTSNKKNLDYLLNKKSHIFEFVNRNKIAELLKKKKKDNHLSKFLFNFISTKIFLDKNFKF